MGRVVLSRQRWSLQMSQAMNRVVSGHLYEVCWCLLHPVVNYASLIMCGVSGGGISESVYQNSICEDNYSTLTSLR